MPIVGQSSQIFSSAQMGADVVLTGTIKDGEILNADINAAAAIAWTKLSKTSSRISDLASHDINDTDTTLGVAKGGTGKTTITAGALIAGNGTGVPTEVTPSAAGKVLTDAGVGNPPSFQTPAGGHFSLISTITLAAVGMTNNVMTKIAEWTGLTGDADDEYVIEFELVSSAPVGVASSLAIRLNDDNTSAHYAQNVITNTTSTTVAAGANSGTEMRIASASSVFVLDSCFGDIKIKASKTIAGTGRLILSNIVGGTAGSVAGINTARGSGVWIDASNQITSIQIYFDQVSGGALTTSGKASLYKIVRA